MNQIVVITSEEYLEGEAEAISALAKQNIRIHLRKPLSAESDFDAFTQNIVKNCDKSQLSIHNFFDIAEKYNIAKHYSYSALKNSDLEIRSCSVHSFSEAIEAEKRGVEYYFLSPIFDSISKSGYSSGFCLSELEEFLAREHRNSSCVALGGISLENIDKIKFFDSIALLGGVWSVRNRAVDTIQTVENLEKIVQKWQK